VNRLSILSVCDNVKIFVTICCNIALFEVFPCYCSATLTEVFPCFFLSCKANARV
jgi:hypothetical protein